MKNNNLQQIAFLFISISVLTTTSHLEASRTAMITRSLYKTASSPEKRMELMSTFRGIKQIATGKEDKPKATTEGKKTDKDTFILSTRQKAEEKRKQIKEKLEQKKQWKSIDPQEIETKEEALKTEKRELRGFIKKSKEIEGIKKTVKDKKKEIEKAESELNSLKQDFALMQKV